MLARRQNLCWGFLEADIARQFEDLGATALEVLERNDVPVLAFRNTGGGGFVFGTTPVNTQAGTEVRVVVPQGARTWSDVHLYVDGRPEERIVAHPQAAIEREISTLGFLCSDAQVKVYRGREDVVSYPSVGPDRTVYVGFGDNLYAIGADGVLDWEYETAAFVYSCPAVDGDGKVFFGSADGKVYALDSEGVKLWDFEVPGPGRVGGAVLAPPSIGADGSVFIAGMYNSTLYALDPANGDIRWQSDLSGGEDATKSMITAPVVAPDGTIYATLLDDTNLYAIDPNNGEIGWSTDLSHEPELIGYWKFDDALGTTARDSSVYRRDGQLDYPEDFRWTGGVIGGASTRNRMQVDRFERDPGTVARTISMWFRWRWPSYTTRQILALEPASGGAESLSLFVNGNVEGQVSGALRVSVNDGFMTGRTDLVDEQWHHLAIVIEDDGARTNLDDVKIYVDGKLDASFESNGGYLRAASGIVPSAETLRYTLFAYTVSVMDDLRIYEVALSEQEIGELMWDETAPVFSELRPVESSIAQARYCWGEVAVGSDGTVYVGFDDPYLRAINPDGTVKWIKHLAGGGNYTLSVGADGLVYAAGEDGVVYVINGDGDLVTRFDADAHVSYSNPAYGPQEDVCVLGYPVIGANGTVYVVDMGGKVWAMSADDCGERENVLTCRKLPMDLNHDCIMNLADFAVIAADWMSCTVMDSVCNDPEGPWAFVPGYDYYSMQFLDADVNNDAYVDFDDIVWMMRTWLMGGDVDY